MKLIKVTAVWCMSCIFMNEILKTVEKENGKLYETIDYDFDMDNKEVAPYSVGNILPVYILIDADNNEIARSIGEKSKKELAGFLSANGGIEV